MIQYYTPDIKRDPNEEKAFNVFKALVEPFKISVKEYYENAYESPELGKVIYETRVSPIVNIWDDPRLTKIYSFWHSAYENLQSANEIIQFLDVLYKSADVYLNIFAPLCIGVDVKLKDEVEVWWNRDSRYNLPLEGWDPDFEDEKDYQLFVKDSDENEPTTGITFTTIPINISSDGLYKIIRDIVYPGLYFVPNLIK